jgi:hypothetical protein
MENRERRKEKGERRKEKVAPILLSPFSLIRYP